jgi:Tfp pilus assembly protein FimT
MLMVVALIGLISLVAIPAFGGFSRAWKLRSNADDMLAVVRSVRQMAISTHQNLSITFTPGKPGSYAYFHPIQGQTVTVTLPDNITMTTNPSGSFAPQYQTNGGCAPSSTPSMSSPTANFVRLSAVINGSRTDTYTFGFSAAGMASYTVTH